MPPLFNRLTVFDPRYPHGVRLVEGVQDPLKARLVLHGWFTEPVPFFDGGAAACLGSILLCNAAYDSPLVQGRWLTKQSRRRCSLSWTLSTMYALVSSWVQQLLGLPGDMQLCCPTGTGHASAVHGDPHPAVHGGRRRWICQAPQVEAAGAAHGHAHACGQNFKKGCVLVPGCSRTRSCLCHQTLR